MFQPANALDRLKTMKRSNFTKIISALCIVFYAWMLGVFGLYGDTIALKLQAVSLFILKYGAILVGAVLTVILPFRIEAALERNKKLEQEKKQAAEQEAKLARQQQEEQMKLAIAKKYEEVNKYE